MKSSGGSQPAGGSFREQVATVSSWFDSWNPCEQTVALYSLLKKLGPVQGRFLGLCLSQQGLQSSKETRITEQNANDPAFVRQLEDAEHLVPHLPLLRPGNEAAKRVYLDQIPRALASALDSAHAVEQARQLLSYALIHPALGADERKLLGQWLPHLENCLAASPQTTMGETTVINNNNSNNNNNNNHIDNNHVNNDNSNNIKNVSNNLNLTNNNSNGVKHSNMNCLSNNNIGPHLTPSHQLHQLQHGSNKNNGGLLISNNNNSNNGLSPVPNSANGGVMGFSGAHDPAMREVMAWLKTLRLHKYANLLMSMTYEQMLDLTDDKLEAAGVTTGARNKLMLNISKLGQRAGRLSALQKEVERGDADLKQVLDELKAMLVTPIKGYPEAGVAVGSATTAPPGEDIPSEITRLLGKLCSTLLVSPMLDHGGLVPTYVQLLDRCLAHDQFCQTLKRRLYSWKQQMARFGTRRRPFTLPWAGKDGPGGLSLGTGLLGPPGLTAGHAGLGGAPPRGTSTLPVFGATRLPTHGQHIMEPEYEDRLESLCLSMTAHAIGDTFST